MSIIVYGKQGCGKTANAKALAQFFSLSHIIDNGLDEAGNSWSHDDPVPDDTLVLTNCAGIAGALNFDKVMSAMESVTDDGLVIIGEYTMNIKPTDTDLIESLRRQGYEVVFESSAESGQHEQVQDHSCQDQRGTGA